MTSAHASVTFHPESCCISPTDKPPPPLKRLVLAAQPSKSRRSQSGEAGVEESCCCSSQSSASVSLNPGFHFPNPALTNGPIPLQKQTPAYIRAQPAPPGRRSTRQPVWNPVWIRLLGTHKHQPKVFTRYKNVFIGRGERARVCVCVSEA